MSDSTTLYDLQKLLTKLEDHIHFLAEWNGVEFPDEVDEPKPQPKYKGQKLMQALENFYDAAVTVSRAFEAAEGDENIYLDDPTGSYPFIDSFEDYLPRIARWVEAVDAELKENYPTEEGESK